MANRPRGQIKLARRALGYDSAACCIRRWLAGRSLAGGYVSFRQLLEDEHVKIAVGYEIALTHLESSGADFLHPITAEVTRLRALPLSTTR